MATLIGVVSQVVGEVFAVAGDGTRRPLVEGDRVYAGEQLITGTGGAVAVTLTNGEVLTLGRDSNLSLNEQMVADGADGQSNQAQDQTPTNPSDGDLTDVEQLQAAIEAGVDPTQQGEATAAGPGGGGAGGAGGAGGIGGGHSFVLLNEVGGALDPIIGFPTEGLNNGPEFPDPEPIVTDEPVADFTPSIDVEYEDFNGNIVVGPAIVDEEGLADGTNPGADSEQASGTLIINSPDGVSAIEIQDFNGNWIDVTNGGVVQGQYGILVVDAAGNWTYTLTDNTLSHGNPNATGAADQVGESFAVRMFDLDGDVSPTVQLNVLVNDDGPVLAEGEGAQVSAIVDEDETSEGITDGDSVTNVATGGPGALGALVNFGADGLGSFGLSGSPAAIASLEAQGLTSGGAALTYSVVGNVLTASVGSETIFTLQVGANGSFNFTLVGPLDHPTPDGNDDELLELPIDFSGVLTATDGDGDSVGTFNGGSFVISVEDDVPQLAGGRGEGEGEGQEFPRVWDMVHEDALTTADGAPHEGNPEGGQTTTASGPEGSLSALVNFGADGPGDFGLSTDVSSMELQGLTSGGDPLTYLVVGNVLTASAGGETIFTLTVNGDGSWEFVLKGPIDHPIPDGTYDSEDLPGLGIDFSGILTATDGDGDPLAGGFPQGSFSVDIEDDVPVLAERGNEFQPVGGTVNEDALSSPHNGNDDAIQQLTVTGGAGALHALVSFGADGPGDFGLTDSEAAYESLSALNLTSGGQPLQFSIDTSTGTLTAFVTGTEAGDYDVFTLQVNADGSYSFILEGPLDHELANGDDGELLSDGGLAIDFSGVLTATDGDGDPLAGSLQSGGFVIDVQDDVPVLADRGEKFEPIGGTVHEDALSSPAPHEGNDDVGQTLTVSGGEGSLNALVDFGADGPGSFGLINIGADSDAAEAALLSLTEQGLESGGQPLQFRMDGDVLVGFVDGTGSGSYDVFSLDVNADGSWLFTLLGPIDHPVKNGDDGETLGGSGFAIDFSGVLAATDGDGDPLVGGFDDGSLLIDVQDDVPVLNAGTAVGTTLTISLEEGSAGYSNTYGYYVKDSSGNPVSGVIIWANVQEVGAPIQLHGVDPDSIGFFIIPDGATNNEIDGYENGAELTFAEVDGQWQAFLNGQPLIGSDGANVLFDNAALNPNGSSQFTDNGAPGNQNWEDISGGGDGDFNDINIQVDWGRFTVHEDALSSPHDGNDDSPQTLVASGSGEDGLSGLIDFGADGPGDFGLVTTAEAQAILEAQGLESGGEPLIYTVEKTFDLDGNLVSTTLTATAAASVGGYPVFSLVVSANGDFTFTLQGPLDHPIADGNDDELWGSGDNLGIDFTQLITATDGDGDPVSIPQSASGLFVVNVEDDVPVLVRGGQIEGQTQVDEDSLVPNGIDDGDGVGAVASGSLNGLVSFGADGPGGFSLHADTSDLPELTSNGHEVEYLVDGDTLTAFVGGADGYPVFTFTLDSDGNYTFTLKGQIDHPDKDGNDNTDILPIDLSSIVQATDGDGDSVVLHNSVIINVEDDVPDARDNQASTTENTLPPFNLTLIIDSSGSMDDMVSADLDGDGTLENATRLDVAKAALINLINSYVALGVPLNFKIIDFDSGASKVYEGTSAADAKNAITSLTEGGNTNYDAALDLARDELEDDLVDPTLDGYVNRVYFLSDGEPFPSSNDAPASWQGFVDDNGIDVIAVGIQIPTGGNAENELGEVGNDGDTVIVVQDPNELAAALAETVPDPLEGNVLTDAGPGGPGDVDQSGADSPLRLTQFSFINDAGATVYVTVPDGGSASTTTPAGGILTMFSDGHWTYVAPDNVTENIDEIFTYTVVDADGDPDTATLTISVEDGVPLAVNDTASMTEDTDKVSGNVITNDTVGTDSPGTVHFANTTGTYGSLVFSPSGGWTYDLQNSNPVVQGLGVGESLTEIFQYTLTDADGDTSPATLTITITGKDDGVDISGLNGNDETVRENDLVDGSSPNSGALVQSGTFTVVAPDGLQSLTVHGINVVSGGVVNTFPQPVTTALGNTLTITGFNQLTGVVSYSYTLVDNASHPTGSGENSIQESFVVQAIDDDGDTDTASLDVTIIDDIPDAFNDTNVSTASESLLTLTGNVLTNDVQGADRVAGGPITAVTLTGTYGTLVLNADGSYTYTLNPSDPQFIALGGGGTGTETFTYTHKDADGDTDTARLVLNIRNNDGDVTINGLDIQGQEEILYENDLALGSSPNAGALTQTGTFTISAADGIQTFSLNGTNYSLAQLQNSGTTNLLVDSPAGTLRITGYTGTSTGGTVSYSYVLDTRVAHANAGGENSVLESFSVKVTDVDGDSDTDSLDIRIVDDVPDAVSDTNASTASESLLTLSGNVLTNDTQGADRVAGGPITAVTLTGTYGTLVLNADGSYTYTLNPSDPQ
ncbi:retention module-containing protein, partial [Pseudomonas sp. Gutcm_11s]|uniref:retention module-containing protein n=1 Tax=Pseudomonas sp. Gutcm_11s TaxID=3026088 RepID=UPI00235E0F35